MPPVSEAVVRARDILASTEAELQRLIAESLAVQRYDDVAALAAMARRLVEAGGAENGSRARTTASEGHSLAAAPEAISEMQAAMRRVGIQPGNGAYPRFEREGKRLVKIGWSKKDRQVYEHKTPFTAVFAVSDALRSQPSRFVMDQVLPIKDADGRDVPSYQAYIVLAWLRQERVVDRNGNDGYTVNSAGLSHESITTKLHSLPNR